jgi:hypothetical protein
MGNASVSPLSVRRRPAAEFDHASDTVPLAVNGFPRWIQPTAQLAASGQIWHRWVRQKGIKYDTRAGGDLVDRGGIP